MRVYPSIFFLAAFLLVAPFAQAQSTWRTHDTTRPVPPVVTPGAQPLPAPPPSDAIVLFDGSSLDNWTATDGSPTKWTINDGVMTSVAGAGYIQSKQAFGDVQLHVEWAAPTPVMGSSQGRGNSGVFLMGKYEVQVLDSYDNKTYADGQAAAVYGQSPPMVNAARPPGEWQSYDIIFRRPRFGHVGEVISPATITVFHNGVLVQDHFEAWGETSWLEFTQYSKHADRLPLAFQDHGNPVRFRNVWVRDLEAMPQTAMIRIAEPATMTLTPEQMDRYVGRYQVFGTNYYRIERDGDALVAYISDDRPKPVVVRSLTHFSLVKTAGELHFELDDNGVPTSMKFDLAGGVTNSRRVDD